MKFTPNCWVCYNGGFHQAGIPFEIDAADAEGLKDLGEVESAEQAEETKPVKKTRKKV